MRRLIVFYNYNDGGQPEVCMHAQSAAAILSTRIRRACLPEVKDGAPPVGNGSISRKEASL